MQGSQKVYSPRCFEATRASNLLDCRSRRIPRVCRSSYAAELLGAEEGIDVVQLARVFVSLVRGGSLRKSTVDQDLNANAVGLTIAVDAKDLRDKGTSDTSSFGSQKSLAFTVAWLRSVLRRPNTMLTWTATSNMFADGATEAHGPDSPWADAPSSALEHHLQPDFRQASGEGQEGFWRGSFDGSFGKFTWRAPSSWRCCSRFPSEVRRAERLACQRWHGH